MYHSMFCTLEEDEHLPLHSWILRFSGLLGHSWMGNALRCVQAHTDLPRVCVCVSPSPRTWTLEKCTGLNEHKRRHGLRPSLWLLLYIPIIWMCTTWCDKNPLLMCIKRMEQRQKMLLFKLLLSLLLLLLLSSFVKKDNCWSIRLTSADSPHLGRGQAYDGVMRFWINYF